MIDCIPIIMWIPCEYVRSSFPILAVKMLLKSETKDIVKIKSDILLWGTRLIWLTIVNVAVVGNADETHVYRRTEIDRPPPYNDGCLKFEPSPRRNHLIDLTTFCKPHYVVDVYTYAKFNITKFRGVCCPYNNVWSWLKCKFGFFCGFPQLSTAKAPSPIDSYFFTTERKTQ